MRFRRNIERIERLLAYELSKELQYKEVTIETPLGTKNSTEIKTNLFCALF
jgi:uracil phosphoribosyltransferase